MDNEDELTNRITGSGGDGYYFITDNIIHKKIAWKSTTEVKQPQEKELIPIYCFNCKKHIDWREQAKEDEICEDCTKLPSELKVPEGHMEEYYESRTERGDACHECGQHPCECLECTSCGVRYVIADDGDLPEKCMRRTCATRIANEPLVVRTTHAIYYEEDPEGEEPEEYEEEVEEGL